MGKTSGADVDQVKAMLAKDKQVIAAAASVGLPVNTYIEQVLFKTNDAQRILADAEEEEDVEADDDDDAPAPPPKNKAKNKKGKPAPKGGGHSAGSTFGSAPAPKVSLPEMPAANPRRFRVDPKLVRTVTAKVRATRASGR